MEHSDQSDRDDSAADRTSDPTSKKTLADIEESEKDSGGGDAGATAPSPDGQFDENDEQTKAGPM